MDPIGNEFKRKIFQSTTETSQESLILEIFRWQAASNNVYREYIQQLRIDPLSVQHWKDIPFLPIEFFKTQKVITGEGQPSHVFTSSGTTGSVVSTHGVRDIALYEVSFLRCFEQFYGKITDYCILALLPSYLERQGSSLVYMADHLIRKSEHPDSGFYMNDYTDLCYVLLEQEKNKQKTLLLGVTYALLDIAERNPLKLEHTLVIETGGMKGKRKEMIREELHALLSEGLGVAQIGSEYGMTELLSQAYALKDGRFYSPFWMKVCIRDVNDPLQLLPEGKTGGINVIDLANLYSCCFIATQDIGKTYADGSFEVLGRFDHSDIRGCNLLYTL